MFWFRLSACKPNLADTQTKPIVSDGIDDPITVTPNGSVASVKQFGKNDPDKLSSVWNDPDKLSSVCMYRLTLNSSSRCQDLKLIFILGHCIMLCCHF